MYPRQVGVCDPAPASRDEEWLLSRQANRPLTDGIRWHVPPTPSRITTACGTRPVDLFAAGNETKPSMQVYTGVQSKECIIDGMVGDAATATLTLLPTAPLHGHSPQFDRVLATIVSTGLCFRPAQARPARVPADEGPR